MDRTTSIKVSKVINGITTAELARRAGVNPITVWRWTAGRPGVSPETARKLEQALFSNGTADAPRQKSA